MKCWILKIELLTFALLQTFAGIHGPKYTLSDMIARYSAVL